MSRGLKKADCPTKVRNSDVCITSKNVTNNAIFEDVSSESAIFDDFSEHRGVVQFVSNPPLARLK